MKTDAQIQKDIIEELDWDPSVHAEDIGVTVKDGVVTLKGVVPTYAEKIAAEKASFRVAGVKAVAEDLEVRLSSGFQRNDTDIAKAAVDALKWNVTVPNETIKVTVENGWVTLTGDVDWNYQKSAAYGAVSFLTGVKGVTNQLNIKTKPQPVDIKRRIQKALRRSAHEEGERINIDVLDGTVVLKGSVRSNEEKWEAQWAAWAMPGVTKVENCLYVS